MAGTVTSKNYIKISKEEYLKLKQIQKHFEKFWKYFTHLQEIEEARQDIKSGKVIAQDKILKLLKL